MYNEWCLSIITAKLALAEEYVSMYSCLMTALIMYLYTYAYRYNVYIDIHIHVAFQWVVFHLLELQSSSPKLPESLDKPSLEYGLHVWLMKQQLAHKGLREWHAVRTWGLCSCWPHVYRCFVSNTVSFYIHQKRSSSLEGIIQADIIKLTSIA